MPSSPQIAVVTCSTRSPRLNPFISQYVYDIIKSLSSSARIDILDLNDQALPLLDEPGIPSHLPADDPTPHYTKDHTRKWSAVVQQYDAFIFATPQYNWSIPASLKNALDFLFHEWKGKPALAVTYGGKGGGKAADHLQQILTGLRMQVITPSVLLTTNSKTLEQCIESGKVSPEDKARWLDSKAQAGLEEGFAKVLELLKN